MNNTTDAAGFVSYDPVVLAMNNTTIADAESFMSTEAISTTMNTTGFVPSEKIYEQRIQAGYVVVGFVIGLLILLVIFLVYISRNEIFLRCKKYLGPTYQVEVSPPGPDTSYQYLEGYNSDHLNRHIDRTKAADF